MKAYQNDYLSEFEQEFEMVDGEASGNETEFELVNDEMDTEGDWQ